MYKAINKELIDQHNQSQKSNLDFDFDYLEQKLKKSKVTKSLQVNQYFSMTT